MAYDPPRAGTLKRKRRRRDDKPALHAKLYLDSNLKGEVGVLSEDLVQDLFPGQQGEDDVRLFAAVTPWTPDPTPSASSWAVLSFRKPSKDDRQLSNSTLRFPSNALGTQSFLNIIQAVSANRQVRQNVPIEIRVSDVAPLNLETVIVSVDVEALQKFEDVRKKYGGGFGNANGHLSRKRGKRAVTSPMEDEETRSPEEIRKQNVREALANVQIVHTGDVVPLPMTHPVTHARAPPAKILACEPVSQGMLSSETKIVVISAAEKKQVANSGRPLLSPRLAEESGEDEDTSTEAFYSATEDHHSPVKPVVTSKSTSDMSNTEDLFESSTEDSNLSDDSDDMISLEKPGLTDQPSGLNSALSAATPRPFGARLGGVSTPGSVFSNMTSTTIRGGQPTRSKVFRTQGLLEKIPEELLYPKPPSDEDAEARVFVDSTALARLGCFSGDWVKVEPSENHVLPQLGAFGDLAGSLAQQWRPVKVYGLPESMSKRPARYQVNPRRNRRDSISSLATNTATVATLYLSPILLANLEQASNVSLSPLNIGKRVAKRPASGRPASMSTQLPPTASEVTLRKVVTPLSNERALVNALYANLKEHFENKQRIVKAGDLIAIPVDESLGRSIYEGEKESSANSELLSRWSIQGESGQGSRRGGSMGVAWFSIEAVTAEPGEGDHPDAMNIWGGCASIDPTKMTMRQSGDDRRKLPPTSSNPWPYYLGIRNNQAKIPASATTPAGIPLPPQPYVSNLQRRLRELISVSTSPRAVKLGMPPLALLLTSTQRSIGKAHTVQQACADLGMHYFPVDAYNIVSESGSGFDTQTQGLLEARCERALDCGPEHTVLCLKHIDTLGSDRVATSLKSVLNTGRVLVATTTDVDKVPDAVRGLFSHELEMTAPDEGERAGILRNILTSTSTPLSADADLSAVALKTAALVAGDLVDVIDRALVARTTRLENLATTARSTPTPDTPTPVTLKDIHLSGSPAHTPLTPADLTTAVDAARANFADAIGAPRIPNVQWSDVGGLSHIQDAVSETIQLPLSRPDLFAAGLKKRSGILFYGPPGTGKTLLAKAIATEFSLNFFSVKGPELLNMYIGESEANVRRVFARARDARPCVVFFDELDSVAPKRGNQGDSGGVMDRIVSQLLAELDGMGDAAGGGGVFVIGATNRPDLLDQALLRPGRFDKMLYLGISETHEKQARILSALTRKFTLAPGLSLDAVVARLPFTYTGADLYALASDALLKAVTRSARNIDTRVATLSAQRAREGKGAVTIAGYFDHFCSDAELEILVGEEDFEAARRELVPSVSEGELGHYERVREAFEGGSKKEGGKGGRAVEGGQVVGEEDDFVVRTGGLSLGDGGGAGDVGEPNGGRPVSSKGKGRAKGKGKGKGREAVEVEGPVDEEDLYD